MPATYPSRPRRVGGLVTLVTVLGCSGTAPTDPTPDTTIASVIVTPATSTLVSIDETTTLSASARTAGGGTLPGTTFTWSVTDGSVVSVDQTGLATALANGSTTVTATANGIAGSATIVVSQLPAEMEKVAGDTQFGEVALPLDSVLVVRVLDALANPIADLDVAFAVTGAGAVADPAGVTDALGQISTQWTLGTMASVQEVHVKTLPESTATATFTATAVAGPPFSVTVANGNDQRELPSYALPLPITVLVTDEFGNTVADIPVAFTASAGTLADADVATALDGLAGTSWTLGAAIGAYSASASVDFVTVSADSTSADSVAVSVDFSATAVAFSLDAPTGASIDAGDTITLSGTGFDPTPLRNTVLVDGEDATILGGTQSSLSIIVPAFGCVPEKPVQVTVQRDAQSDAASTVWHPADILALAVGEQRVLDTPEDFCLQFLADPTGGDEYLIGVTATQELDAEMTVTLLGHDGVTEPVLPSPARSPALAVRRTTVDPSPERVLRAWEYEHQRLAAPNAATIAAGPARAPPSDGERLNLKVPNIGADVCMDYAEISTTVRAVGTNVALATDDLNPAAEALDASDLTALLALVDNTLFGAASAYLGTPSDLDGNERILIVVTQEVNRLDVGLGFTTAADLFASAGCPSSDGGEIIYVAAPDPSGTVGTSLSKSSLLTDLPPQLAHELAHAIQFGRRIAAGVPLMTSWLAEGQAQVVKEAAGFQILGDTPGADYRADQIDSSAESTLWYAPQFEALSRFFGWDGVSSRVAEAPDRCSVFGFPNPSTACSGSYARGAAWSMLRYVTDRFGSDNPSALHMSLIDSDGSLDATASLADAVGITFESVLVDWAATLYVDGQVSAGDAPTLQLGSWNLHDVFGALPAERRLSPMQVGFSTFGISRAIVGGGTAYTILTQAGPRGPIAIRLRGAQDQTLGSVLAPRLWVVRVR